MAEPLSTESYDSVVVIDTQVVLETKPLDQLPWGDLFPGNTLLLVSRQVQSEIDARKNDSRLGKRARDFNKLLDGFVETRLPVSVLVAPRVDVALLTNRRIDWDGLDDLDRDDGDDRIVAQALHADVDQPSRLVVFSHDMRPRDAARLHGLHAVKLPEHWLREPEPSPDRRRITELEDKIRLLSAHQPRIDVTIETISPAPWTFHDVAKGSPERMKAVLDALLGAAPLPSRRDGYGLSLGLQDPSHAGRLDTWKRWMHADIPRMHEGLTRLFAQHRIRISIKNVGSVSAEDLSLEVRSGNAVLHLNPYGVMVSGPPAPQSRPFHTHMLNLRPHDFAPRQREKFAFYRDESGPGDHVIVSCASFRQGKTYDLEVSLELLAGTAPKAQIEAIVTASNMKGDARHRLIVPVERVETPFDDIYDASRRLLKRRPPFEMPDDIESDEFTCYRNDGSEYDAP